MGSSFKGATKNTDANALIQQGLEESKETIEYFGAHLEAEVSLRLEQSLLSETVLSRRMEALRRADPDQDPGFVKDSAECLLKNRFLLRGLRAFRHFLFPKPRRSLKDYSTTTPAQQREAEAKADAEAARAAGSGPSSRGSLGRELSKDLKALERALGYLHQDLSRKTEQLAHLIGRRTFQVARGEVLAATDAAANARRALKRFLRQSELAELARPSADGTASTVLADVPSSSGESKNGRPASPDLPVSTQTFGTLDEQYQAVAVRGLSASLRQLSDGTSAVESHGLRSASASSEEGRNLFDRALATSSAGSTSSKSSNEAIDPELTHRRQQFWTAAAPDLASTTARQELSLWSTAAHASGAAVQVISAAHPLRVGEIVMSRALSSLTNQKPRKGSHVLARLGDGKSTPYERCVITRVYKNGSCTVRRLSGPDRSLERVQNSQIQHMPTFDSTGGGKTPEGAGADGSIAVEEGMLMQVLSVSAATRSARVLAQYGQYGRKCQTRDVSISSLVRVDLEHVWATREAWLQCRNDAAAQEQKQAKERRSTARGRSRTEDGASASLHARIEARRRGWQSVARRSGQNRRLKSSARAVPRWK